MYVRDFFMHGNYEKKLINKMSFYRSNSITPIYQYIARKNEIDSNNDDILGNQLERCILF